MKAIPWLIAGIGLGAVAVYILSSTPEYSTSSDTVEGVARKTFGWGTKQRIAGKGQAAVGAVKQGIGKLGGDPDLEDEGSLNRVVGNAREAVGKLGEAAAETIHDLNV
jgi:uncharacterized protein YjbJ (UPF0337 family)